MTGNYGRDRLANGGKQEEWGFTVSSKAPPFMRSFNDPIDHSPQAVASHLHPSFYS